jgi:hypothetical protein
MGIRAVRSESSCGQPHEGTALHFRIGAVGPRIGRPGNRTADEVSSLEQPVRWGERRYFGRPRWRRWLQRTGDPCSWGCFTARETGWRGGSAVRVHRAIGRLSVRETGRNSSSRTGAPCSEVGAGESGNRNDGTSLMAQATHT